MDQVLLIGTVAAAFLFAFVNGWHDGFNVVATSVLSRSMSPARALFLASAAAVAGALILGTAVAKTLGSELIHAGLSGPGEMVPLVLIALSAVISALTWNLMTWAMGHSPSSSHALVGGLLGGALAARGLGVVVWKTLSWKILAVLLIAPPLGTLLGQWALSLSRRVLRRSPPSGREFFTRRQSLGLVFLSAGHGANDAQKAMGIITMALVSSGSIPGFSVPLWVVLGCGGALAAGIFVGGCKIVKVLGEKTFKIEPIHSFNAQVGAAAVLLATALVGNPVSTTQIVKSTILGVGEGYRRNPGRWIVVKDILIAWFITVPATAFLAATITWTLSGLLGKGMGSFGQIMRFLGQ